MKVFAINGSARKNGNTALLIGHVFAELEKSGIECEMVQLAGHSIRGCTACNKCRDRMDRKCANTSDLVNSLIEKMAEADGIILASPVYYSDITPELKAVIDRSGRVAGANGGLFKRKVGSAVMAVRRGGALHAMDSIHHYMHLCQMIIPGASYWNFGIGRDIGDVESDTEGLQNMKVIGENMAWLMQKLVPA